MFRPADTCRLLPSGLFPLREPYRLSTAAALLTFSAGAPPTEASDSPTARLQGLAPPESPLHIRQVLPQPMARYPHGISFSRVFPLPAVGCLYSSPPLSSFPVFPYETGTRLLLRVLPNREPGWSLARLPTLLKFATSSTHSLVRIVTGPGLSFRLGADPASPRDPHPSLVRAPILPEPSESPFRSLPLFCST